MTVWRYTAVPKGAGRAAMRTGELAGGTAADVRAALRRIDLQVVDLARNELRVFWSHRGQVRDQVHLLEAVAIQVLEEVLELCRDHLLVDAVATNSDVLRVGNELTQDVVSNVARDRSEFGRYAFPS